MVTRTLLALVIIAGLLFGAVPATRAHTLTQGSFIYWTSQSNCTYAGASIYDTGVFVNRNMAHPHFR